VLVEGGAMGHTLGIKKKINLKSRSVQIFKVIFKVISL
jgi:hypothetical protein